MIADAMRMVRPDFAHAARDRCVTFLREMDDYELVSQVGSPIASLHNESLIGLGPLVPLFANTDMKLHEATSFQECQVAWLRVGCRR